MVPAFRPTSVIIHPDVQDQYDALERAARARRQPEAAVWKSFQTQVLRLKADGQWGEVIPRSRIPRHFLETYAVANLYCLDLASFRRCFYTIRHRDVVLLDLVDHATYDRWFNVRKR